METSVELAGLASAAAARLIDLLATDGWGAVRSSVLALWRSAHPERVEDELGEARDELLRARESGGAEELQGLLVTEWQARLIRLMAARPDAVDELRALFGGDPHTGRAPERRIAGPMTLETHVSGGDAYVAGRDMTITRDGQA